MSRFHIHIAVDDLAHNIAFYSALFGAQPSVLKDDYAKWSLENPALNFAISNRGAKPGLDHVGIQAESEQELAEIRARLEQADIQGLAQKGAECCYAVSDKYWVTDRQGIAWESFYSLGQIPMFGLDVSSNGQAQSACCEKAESGCCS